jgi:phosphatidylglycerophosphate synthase
MRDTCDPREAYKLLVKPTDGLISRLINRRVSIRITCFIINHGYKPSPNTVTVIVSLIGFITALIIPFNPLIGGILVEFTSIIDGVDGEIARLLGRTSRFGAFLDSMLDRFVDASIIISTTILLLRQLDPLWVIIIGELLLFSSIIVSYLHARGEASLNTSLQLIGYRLYAGRDSRLFILFLALVLINYCFTASLTLLLFLIIYQLIYVIYKIIASHKYYGGR